jgi:ribosome maturation factor RimP
MRLFIILLTIGTAHSFAVQSIINRPSFYVPSTVLFKTKREKSRVVDLDGPTPEQSPDAVDMIDIADLPELEYDENNHPIPHQPWRRGETGGCEDPIRADWRQRAEGIITLSAANRGATVRDVTWYLTSVVITIENDLSQVPQYEGGPEVVTYTPGPPQYFDPENPEPEPIVGTGEDIVWERDVVAEEDRERNQIAPRQEGDDESFDEDMEMASQREKRFLDKETREDMAGLTDEEIGELESAPVAKDSIKNYMVDSLKISTIAKAILDGLELVEDELQILSRHEVIITTPGASDILETQREFDAYRGFDVIVETQDPWESNRVLRGKLLERNSMDLIINKKGRMVTIPLNFVKCVKLPPAKREKGVPRDAPF